MKKKLFNTSSLVFLVLLLLVCVTMYLVLRPDYVGVIYVFNFVSTIVMCILLAYLLSLPKRKYTSRRFLGASWSYLIFFLFFTIIGLHIFNEDIANELSTMAVAIRKNMPVDMERMGLLEHNRDVYLMGYFGIFILVSLFWFLIIGKLYVIDAKSEVAKYFIDKGYEKAALVNRLLVSTDRYKEICNSVGIYPESAYKFERIASEIESLSSDVMVSPEKLQQLKEVARECEAFLDVMEEDARGNKDLNPYQLKIQLFANKYIDELVAMNNISQ